EDLTLWARVAQVTVRALESAEGHRTIEVLNRDLKAKVEKISEQQRRILALQSQLRRHGVEEETRRVAEESARNGKDGAQAAGDKGRAPAAPGGIVGGRPGVPRRL